MIKLSPRERTLLKLLGVLIGIVVLYFVVVSPFIHFKDKSEDELRNNIDRLNQLDKIYAQYREIKNKKAKMMAFLNRRDENITSLVEQWATSTNIAKNIAYTRRTQSNIQNKFVRITTDIKFEGIPIDKILRFIYEVENSNKMLKVSYLRIQQGLKGTNTYDVVLKIDSFTTQ